MIGPVSSEQFSLALVNAALLALWPVLPALLFGYVRQSAAARRVRPAFALRQSETHELHRAIRLYGQVCERLTLIKPAGPASRVLARHFDRPGQIGSDDIETLDDLQAHAQLLRETIGRLQRRPLQRLRSWMHLISSKAALGRALAAHVVGFGLAARRLPSCRSVGLGGRFDDERSQGACLVSGRRAPVLRQCRRRRLCGRCGAIVLSTAMGRAAPGICLRIPCIQRTCPPRPQSMGRSDRYGSSRISTKPLAGIVRPRRPGLGLERTAAGAPCSACRLRLRLRKSKRPIGA